MDHFDNEEELLQRLRRLWREFDFLSKHGYHLFTSISFGLCLLLMVKFFGFDRTPRCSDYRPTDDRYLEMFYMRDKQSDVCEFEMLIMLFSLAYSTFHLFALLFGFRIMARFSKFSSRDAIPVAMICAGIAFFVVTILGFVLTVYSAAAFNQRWTQAAFYCFCWMLQPVFTILAVYMWKKEQDQAIPADTKPNNMVAEIGSRATVFSAEPRPSSESDYTSLMMISPRLSTALIQQWIDRLCEVEIQNEPIEMRRTVREVLQHMNSMINYA